MSNYVKRCVITGGTTGIGACVRESMIAQGYEVFNIDYNQGDYIADLTTKEGRVGAIQAVYDHWPEGIDVLVCNAGLGPTAPPEKIFALNFFASVEIAECLRPLLRKRCGGNCVITTSNSITNQTVRMDWVDMLSSVMDEERIMEFVRTIPQAQSSSCYSSSKHALARWVRRISPSWATDGLRINSVAPGNTTTPMTKGMTPSQMEAALLIPIPTRYGRKEFLDAEEIADGIVFLASPMASGINGVNLFIDGGIDALLRSEQI